MNLMKLFNFKFLIQNLKKSRGILLLSFIAMPIFTFIMMLGYTTDSYSMIVGDLETLSPVVAIFSFILPVILAITLFNFIFKRKSVDFVNSMPISKKSIYVTNFIGGTLLIIFELLVSLLIIILFSMISPAVVITPNLCFDYLIVWFITYLFMFTTSIFAVSVSGNVVTSLVVLTLVVCFIPFFTDYIKYYNNVHNYTYNLKCEEEACKPQYYYCYSGDKECKINKSLGIYEVNLNKKEVINHSMSYNLISYVFNFANLDLVLFNPISIIKTIIMSIILFILGLFSFINRKMEVCETSFKSIDIHFIVKCLTLLPMGLLLYEFINSNDITILIGFAMIVIYYFAYDLITRRSITYFKKSLVYFGVSMMIYLGIAGFVDSNLFRNINMNNNNNKIYSNDITEIRLTDLVKNDLFEDYIDNKEIINFVLSRLANNESIYSYEDNYISYSFYNVLLKTKDGSIYEGQVPITVSDYEKLLTLIKADKDVSKELKKFDVNNLIAIKFNNSFISLDDDIVKLLKDRIRSLDNETYYLNIHKDYIGFDVLFLYSYENHKLNTYYLSLEINAEIENYIADYNNSKLKDILDYKFDNEQFIINIDYLDSDSYNYDDNSWYFVNELSKELYEFTKKYQDKPFDSNKDRAVIRFYYNGMTRYFYTNEVEELEKLYLDKKEKIINTKEYQDYIKEMGEKLYD